MKVALTCTVGACGVAEVGANIMRSMPEVEYKVITDLTDGGIRDGSQGCDLVHMVWEYDLYRITPAGIKSWGRPVVATFFNSLPMNRRVMLGEREPTAILAACDRVVCTDPTAPEASKYLYAPYGIPTGRVDTRTPRNMVGTIGFPFAWKRIPEIAIAAWQAGMGFLGILPTHPWMLTEECKGQQAIIRTVPGAEVYDEWMPVDEVFHLLGQCKVVAFCYPQNDAIIGVSGSTRYGLATGRPAVFSNHAMYCDLFPYKDELYFVDKNSSFSEKAEAFKEAATGEKRPKRVLEDLSLERAATVYRQCYRELYHEGRGADEPEPAVRCG